MLQKQIIVALDIKEGRIVKGVQFENTRDVGDPVERAVQYENAGADELVFLDITATDEHRGIMADLAAKVCSRVSVPITVGGGLKSLEDIEKVLLAGADKVFINSAAVRTPQLIADSVERFGAARIVVAIDGKRNAAGEWEVFISGGHIGAGKGIVEWAQEVERLGAGEILFTSMDTDGMQAGYDIPMTRAVAEAVQIPVTASGGAGNIEHLYEALTEGKAASVLVASMAHFGDQTVEQMKEELRRRGVDMA